MTDREQHPDQDRFDQTIERAIPVLEPLADKAREAYKDLEGATNCCMLCEGYTKRVAFLEAALREAKSVYWFKESDFDAECEPNLAKWLSEGS